ncbi:MAG TPA: peroxiredoxin family protein [Myxococcales bacterium]
MRREDLRSIALGAGALICGLPLYLLLDRLHLLSPSLRETPWPLAIPALLALGTLWLRRPRRGVASTACAVASVALLAAAGAQARRPLPPAARETAVGSKLPPIVLRDEHGQNVDLRSLRGKPAVILLYRGAWCPSCRRQLSALAKEADRFLAAGVSVVGVSPDAPEMSAKWAANLAVPFPLLSDEDSKLANQLCGGDSHCQLLVDPAGTIRWASLNDNWRELAPPNAVLQNAWRLR